MVFVVTASLIYTRGMTSKRNFEKQMKELKEMNRLKDRRMSRVFISGTVGAILASLVGIITVNYIMYPIIYKKFGEYGYTPEFLLGQYEVALQGIRNFLPAAISRFLPEKVGSVERGVVIFNESVTFVKLFGVTVVTSLLYKPISRVLHYRPKAKEKK